MLVCIDSHKTTKRHEANIDLQKGQSETVPLEKAEVFHVDKLILKMLYLSFIKFI